MSTSELKAGEKAFIVGLVGRQDLNGQIVTLKSWSEELNRWLAYCDGSGEGVQVRPKNLFAPSDYSARPPDNQPYSLPLCIRDCLTNIVGGNSLAKHEISSQAGQITWDEFEGIVEGTTSLYGDPPPGLTKEAVVAGLVLDFIGKDGDSVLLLQSLKRRLQDAYSTTELGFCTPLPPVLANVIEMSTAADISQLMIFMRMDTLLHIKNHNRPS